MEDVNSWLPTIIATVVVILGFIGVTVLIKKAAREIAELFTVLADALEDDSLSSEEYAKLIKEFKDILAVFKKKVE